MSAVIDIVIVVLILVGAAFVLIGSWGLVRFPTTMERLHGPSDATTLGIGGLLLASIVYFRAKLGIWTLHELLILLFLFITTPITANMIAKLHLHRVRTGAANDDDSIAGRPPRPGSVGADGEAVDWATFEAPHPNSPGSTASD